MRDELELMREQLVSKLDESSTALYVFDGVGAIIDKAEEIHTAAAAVVQVAPISIMLDLLDDKLQPIRNSLTLALRKPKPARRNTAVRNKKPRVKARTAQRTLKRSTR